MKDMPLFTEIKSCSKEQLQEYLDDNWLVVRDDGDKFVVGKVNGYTERQCKLPVYNMSNLKHM